MRGFFPIKKNNAIIIAVIIIYSVIICTPWAVRTKIANIALNVWLSIAGTFLFAILSILLLVAEKKEISRNENKGVGM